MNMKEYYEMYLTLHQNKICRRLHVLGQIMTLLWVAGCLWYEYFWFLLLTPFIVYPFAWSGHYFFEKNQPAAFKDPVKAKISDWMMLWDILNLKKLLKLLIVFLKIIVSKSLKLGGGCSTNRAALKERLRSLFFLIF
jgi:hypothetical protein